MGYLDRYRKHIYTLVSGDSIPMQLTSGDYDDSDPVWSPDGMQIAFVSNRSEDPDGNSDSNIWVVVQKIPDHFMDTWWTYLSIRFFVR